MSKTPSRVPQQYAAAAHGTNENADAAEAAGTELMKHVSNLQLSNDHQDQGGHADEKNNTIRSS